MIDTSAFTAQMHVAHWGWTIALFLWLVGLSGMGMFINHWLRERRLTWLCAFSAVAGTLFVMSHLTRILNLPAAAIHSLLSMSFNFSSWMFIGICLLVVQCVLTLFASLVLGGVLFRGGRSMRLVESRAFTGLAAATGVAVTLYSAFLLTQAVGIPFWNTAMIPVLWLLSGLASALGAVEILAALGRFEEASLARLPHAAGLWVEVGELFALFALLHVGSSAVSAAARAGAGSMLAGDASPLFWIGAVGCGAVIPLVIHLLTCERRALALGGAAALVGALCLRAAVLAAGYYEPTLL